MKIDNLLLTGKEDAMVELTLSERSVFCENDGGGI